MKKIVLLIAITIFMLSISSCKKAEGPEASAPKMAPGPIMDTNGLAGSQTPAVKKVQFQIVVPPEVKERWTAVKLIVEDKKENKKEEHTVNIGGEFKISGSNLTVKTGPFIPDFKMSGQIITSASNDPNNPAIGVAVYENDTKLFPSSGKWGWIYANFPTIHSFQHERYGLALTEGVRK